MTPACPKCKGRGWFESFVFDSRGEIYPCPKCNPIYPPTVPEIVALSLGFICLVALVIWGAR